MLTKRIEERRKNCLKEKRNEITKLVKMLTIPSKTKRPFKFYSIYKKIKGSLSREELF